MKFICFLPYSNIDWSATGSMIGGICGLAAIIVSIIIARRQGKTNKLLAEKTNTFSNNQIKISLFERRFQIYEDFRNVFDFFDNWIINKNTDKEINEELSNFCVAFDFKIETASNTTKDMFHNIARQSELQKNIKKSKFTFENREIDYIEQYFEIVLTEVYYFCKLMGSKSTDYEKVAEIHNEIKKRRIIELMEKELILENLPNTMR